MIKEDTCAAIITAPREARKAVAIKISDLYIHILYAVYIYQALDLICTVSVKDQTVISSYLIRFRTRGTSHAVIAEHSS